MNIIIVGAGSVGTHLARMLSGENENIVIMDTNEEKIGMLQSNYDLMGIVGNPTSIRDIEGTGVKDADLFIAVTPEESCNISACIIASSLGAKRTVARIDNYEYLLPKNKAFFDDLGVNSLIYPEMLAAKEIASAIKRPWVRYWFEFAGGSLIMVGTKVEKESELIKTPLYELSNNSDKHFHIVAIKRKNETLIPSGQDVILENDIVFFTTTREHIDYIRKISGKASYTINNITIMGGSRIAIRAVQYIPSDIDVKIIESDRRKCEWINERVSSKTLVIHGDGRDFALLKQEGLEHTDAFIALTDNSETNILSCAALKRIGLKKSVAEVENLDYISMADTLNIGTIINKKMIAASHIFQMMLDVDATNVKCLTFSHADVAEMIAKEDSKITRKKVKDLGIPKEVVLGGLIRKGKGYLIGGETQIMPNDHVVVFCLNSYLYKIKKYFK